MPKAIPDLLHTRREEIIDTCKTLYENKGFREITIKDIGALTTFTRTSIYNYFQTKEEIFLAMHQREYEHWNDELQAILDANESLTKDDFANKIASSLEHRSTLLKLLSINHFDMEKNCRQEMLVEFKKAYGNSLSLIQKCLHKFFPELSDKKIESFIYIFFPFLFGIYPYTEVTENQRNAMRDAGLTFKYQTVHQITYRCIRTLLD
ncbi:MAG: TetR/AcrR family transcriptional regulator [Proteobacteria bacterium]|nr:TetR/AcrR family transcriptional regulator [Pseudomonadota bacterium]